MVSNAFRRAGVLGVWRDGVSIQLLRIALALEGVPRLVHVDPPRATAVAVDVHPVPEPKRVQHGPLKDTNFWSVKKQKEERKTRSSSHWYLCPLPCVKQRKQVDPESKALTEEQLRLRAA